MGKITSFKNILFFFFYLICNLRLIPLALRNIYLPVFVQFEWLKRYNIATVIDIGANRGHTVKALRHIFPKATIYAFEPIKEECVKIKKRVSSPNLIVENVALSNKKGITTLYKYNYTPASSMLPFLTDYIKKFKGLSRFERIQVETTTLDSYFENINLSDMVFLKIDTQGTEKLILEGGGNLLKDVSIIHIETSFVELYKNQCLFKDVYNYLIKLGFKYMGSVNEAHFYPIFEPYEVINSIFLKPGIKIHE